MNFSPSAVFDRQKFVGWLEQNAFPAYGKGKCALHIRLALQHAGVDTTGNPPSAKDWAAFLRRGKAFVTVDVKDFSTFKPEIGDIAVFGPWPGSNDGHIEAYNGREWISDYRQGSEFWPSRAARKAQARVELFRYATVGVARRR